MKEPKWPLGQLRRLKDNGRQAMIGNNHVGEDVGGQGPPDQTIVRTIVRTIRRREELEKIQQLLHRLLF